MRMYRFYGILFTVVLSVYFGCTPAPEVNLKNVSGIDHHAGNNRKMKENPKVVFIGNSITINWYNTNPDFFNSNNYANRGIGGQTTPQFLLRFRKDVIDLQPEIVVINGGINDIAENTGTYDEDFTFDCIVSMVELAKANDIPVILTSVLPAGHISWRMALKNIPGKVISLNRRLEEYAEQNNIVYADYYSSMADKNGAMDKKYTTDGVHPVWDGYIIMEQIIRRAINETEKRSIKISSNLSADLD